MRPPSENLGPVPERTLSKVEADLASGDLGKARDRLHGLLVTYPHVLALRRKLGDIYWQLQYPAMAGRYWYLEEDKSSAMERACRAFERSCGDDPLQILLALKFRGELETIRDTFAGQTLLTLQKRVNKQPLQSFEFGKRGKAKYGFTVLNRTRDKYLLVGCSAGALVALALMIIGLVAALQWVF